MYLGRVGFLKGGRAVGSKVRGCSFVEGDASHTARGRGPFITVGEA